MSIKIIFLDFYVYLYIVSQNKQFIIFFLTFDVRRKVFGGIIHPIHPFVFSQSVCSSNIYLKFVFNLSCCL